ncbi:MAG: S9 family peptidase [Gammaproteobacteria bacterium]|nr:S9 family peptidase [Gammaproteobacteria bacterium]
MIRGVRRQTHRGFLASAFSGVLLLVIVTSACSTRETDDKSGDAPPVAKKSAHELLTHGHSRIDDYYWMRDDTRTDPEIIAHLEAENAYTENRLAHLAAIRSDLYLELTGRLNKNYDAVPYRNGEYFYYHRYANDAEYPVYARRKGSLQSPEEILIDASGLAAESEYFSIGGYAISPDDRWLAYSVDTQARGIYFMRFVDLSTNAVLSDRLEGVEDSFVWANDNETLFYIRQDLQTLLGNRIYRHRLGTDQSTDVLVYEELDTSMYIDIRKSMDGTTLIIDREATDSAESLLLDADTPEGEFRSVLAARDGHRYEVRKNGGWIYLLTDSDAPDFRVVRVAVDLLGSQADWEEVVAAHDGVLFQEMLLLEDRLLLRERRASKVVVGVYGLDGQLENTIEFDEPGYSLTFSNNYEQSAKNVRLRYSSFSTPVSIYDVDIFTGLKNLLKKDEVVGNFDGSNYGSERFFVDARDGERIPVSVAYRKSLFKKDSTNPLLQFGYGAYGANYDPWFDTSLISLMDRGVVVAMAHVRGGSMLGRAWYEDGRLLNKKNTFTDFIDVTQGLVREGYAAPDKVIARGTSAGGLLMGAVANMAPELYLAIIARVPFVDAVTTMLDASIPLTSNEWNEWGDPRAKVHYDYMLSYSPYDQVKAQAYPNLLVTAGFNDSQVQYFEPAKWVAKLRELKTDDNTLLFRINMGAGHGGASGRFRAYEERAMEYAFIFDLWDIAGAAP